MNKRNKVFIMFYTILFFICSLLILSNLWIYQNFGQVKIQEILFTLISPTAGTDVSLIFSYIFKVIGISIFLTVLSIMLLYILNKKIKPKVFFIIKSLLIFILSLTFVLNLFYINSAYGIYDYYSYKNQKTTIYNKNKKSSKKKSIEYIGDENIIYQDPNDIKIETKDANNLIYIYLESIENSFFDKENGGIKNINCLPELTSLATQNINFSNSDTIGGALPFTGTTWTIASMTAQMTGLPLKVEVANDMDKQNQFMPGAKTISDFLHEQGYYQELMIGSEKEFAGTDKLFLQHGYDSIVDLNSLKNSHSFKRDELNEWGLYDYKLFELAKEELNQLSKKGKFNFTMATIDCHTPNGFMCKYCPHTYNSNYENIYACQSMQVSNFIEWCKTQSWYNQTTIVLVGDHPTMAQSYIKDIPSTYQRTTYNCFINSKVKTTNNKNRQFTHMDMYPTTLAALGYNIEGNKLGLGTNLFSKLPTIIEKYGQDYINQEVQKSNDYLNKNIYQFN